MTMNNGAVGVGVSGFGGGMLRGLETVRRHKNEDEAMAMRRRQMDMQEQSHGLQMRRGEQQYQQADQLFPEQLQSTRTTNKAAGLQLKDAERKDWAADIAHKGKQALHRATQGDLNAINEFAIDVYGTVDGMPEPLLILPGQQPGTVIRKPMSDEAGEQAFEEPLDEALRRFALHSNPDEVYRMFTAPKEARKTQTVARGGALVDAATGEELYRNPYDGGGSGGGSRGIEEQRLMDRVAGAIRAPFKTRLGAEFIGNPENANVQAEIEKLGFEIVHNGRVIGGDTRLSPEIVGNQMFRMVMSGDYHGIMAKEAKQMAIEQLSWKDRRDPKKVEAAAAEIQAAQVQKLREDAVAMFLPGAQGGQAGLDMQRPAAGGQAQATPAAGAQQQSAGPATIRSRDDYDALPSGAEFINPADGQLYIKP